MPGGCLQRCIQYAQVIANDRLGRKGQHVLHSRTASNLTSSVRVKCSSEDTVGDLKKLIAAQTGTDASKIVLKKWCVSFSDLTSVYRDHKGVQVHYLQGSHNARRL